MNIIRDLQFPTSFNKKSKLEIERKSFSRIGAKLWNEKPTKLRTLPKLIFKRKIRMILFNILESEDSYEDLESIISQVKNTLSSYHLCFVYLILFILSYLSTSHNILRCQFKLVSCSSCFCRLNLFSYLLIYFILL